MHVHFAEEAELLIVGGATFGQAQLHLSYYKHTHQQGQLLPETHAFYAYSSCMYMGRRCAWLSPETSRQDISGPRPEDTLRALRHCLRRGFSCAGFPEGSLFRGTEISERVHVSWGTFALVEATRALMRAGLEDPLNQKFVLLSEAGIPLYPPDLVYVQLMSEDKSRINSCVVPGVGASPLASVAPTVLCLASLMHRDWNVGACGVTLHRGTAEQGALIIFGTAPGHENGFALC